jgi:hypothetical protein
MRNPTPDRARKMKRAENAQAITSIIGLMSLHAAGMEIPEICGARFDGHVFGGNLPKLAATPLAANRIFAISPYFPGRKLTAKLAATWPATFSIGGGGE